MAVDVNDLTGQFVEAFNARDWDSFRELFTDDAEFRRRGQPTLRGEEGARAVLAAAEDTNMRLEPRGEQELDGDRVTLPVRVIAGTVAVDGTAVFELRDGKIAAFEVLTEA
jgi:hypothetical protein